MSCRTVRPWLHVAAERLPEPDRLVLEEHLQACERCRTERAQLALVRRVGEALPASSIGPRGHGRAIAAALMRGPDAPVPTGRPAWRFAIAGLAATAVITLVVAIALRSSDEVVPVAVQPTTPAPAPRPPRSEPRSVPRSEPRPMPVVAPDRVVVEGELEVAGVALARDAEVPSNTRLVARTAARLRVFGTQVVVAAASQFIVRERTIVVLRGSAVVTPKDGAARRIEAGGQWPSEPVRGRDELAAAHAAYARGDFARAEQLATAALAARLDPTQAADAETVIAECRQAAGAVADALARYEAIAARYARLPAGETAAFAAARLALRTSPARARSLYEGYLARYPQGRFAADARRALEGVPR